MLWSLFLPPLCQVDNSLYHRFTPHHLQIGPEVKIFRARPSHNQTLSLIRAESTVSDGIVMLSPLVSGTNPRLILTSLASRDQSTNGIIMSPLWTLWLCNPVSCCIEQSAVTVIDLICQLHWGSPHPSCVSVVLTIVIWLTLATQDIWNTSWISWLVNISAAFRSALRFKNSILINSKTCFPRHDCVLSEM